MKLNAVEKLLMNNPVRAAVQRRYEAPLLRRIGGPVFGGRVLEIGCGRGVGVQAIFDVFGARHVDAFDVDPDMVERARRRLATREHVRLWVGSATDIEAPDGHYDAVFDFGVVHHVPDWGAALDEAARVLRPKGRFFFEEVTKRALDKWSYRTFFEHPEHNRFTAAEFVEALESRGVEVEDRWVTRFRGDFVLGVGRRVDEPTVA